MQEKAQTAASTNEAALFIKAVTKGIKCGGYVLIRKKPRGYTRYYAPEKVLGEYDYTTVRLNLKKAHELYSALSGNPLTVKELCGELERAGLIPTSKSSSLMIAGERHAAITIKRGDCRELNNLILGFYL